MRNAFLQSLTHLIRSDENVMLLTADLGYGVFEPIEEEFPKQYINVGVAEQNMTGLATGLALEGHTVFTYSIGNFPTLRCLEQIRNDACYHDVNVNVVCTGGGFSYGALGMSHHATEDLSILRALPNVTLVAPGDVWEAGQATEALAASSGVGYLRLDKTAAEASHVDGEQFVLGKARRVREGSDMSLIAAGGILGEVVKAAEKLAEDNIHCRVVSMHTVKPLDADELLSCCQETGGIVTVEENNVLGGLGGAVAEFCLEQSQRPTKFKRIGLQDVYSSVVGSQTYLRNYYQIGTDNIVTTVRELV